MPISAHEATLLAVSCSIGPVIAPGALAQVKPGAGQCAAGGKVELAAAGGRVSRPSWGAGAAGHGGSGANAQGQTFNGGARAGGDAPLHKPAEAGVLKASALNNGVTDPCGAAVHG